MKIVVALLIFACLVFCAQASEQTLEASMEEHALFFRRAKRWFRKAKRYTKKVAKKVARKASKTYKKVKSKVVDKVNSARLYIKYMNRLRKVKTVKFNGKKKQCFRVHGNYCGGGWCGGKWWDGCNGRKLDGSKGCYVQRYQWNRPKPIDAVDRCCMTHDDCCSKLGAGESKRCTCNRDMARCYQKAIKQCKTKDCKVVGKILATISQPFKIVGCGKSCFDLEMPFKKGFKNALKVVKKKFSKVKKSVKKVGISIKRKSRSVKRIVSKRRYIAPRIASSVRRKLRKLRKYRI
eukprot:gene3625-6441_t